MKVFISYSGRSGPILFAAGEIRGTLEALGVAVEERSLEDSTIPSSTYRIALFVEEAEGRKGQGFALKPGESHCDVAGADVAGVMYGGLELAEMIRLNKGLAGLKEVEQNPTIARRGLKFNIPLDARTPSYSDAGDAAQKNIATVWELGFWREFLDDMARHRYNTLTLWNPHPFPSIVKVPEYPDVALADVKRADLDWVKFNKEFNLSGTNMVTDEVLNNLVTLKKMTIEEKIEFWRAVMQHAKDRGIDMYFITWNVFTWGADGKYGITSAQDNPKTIAYVRASVRETILTYPLLAGIGVTAGERMQARKDEFSKEKWLWAAYGEGVLDAKKKHPGRSVRFIHRHHQTGLDSIMEEFGDRYPDPFDTGFKYARARLYSGTKPPFANELKKSLIKHDMKCWWNLRNDDIFYFRWGDPKYVRDFIGNLPSSGLTAGYHMGSDGYVWGREFTSLKPDDPRQPEIKKHWFNFMLWGRLGYDYYLGEDRIEALLQDHFPQVPAKTLGAAWAESSKIVPLVNRFHWLDWDFMWSVEGCLDHNKGFHTVKDFIKMPRCSTMEGSGLVTIPDYIAAVRGGKKIAGRGPGDVARELDERAAQALKGALELRGYIALSKSPVKPTEELFFLIGDIESMAHLGNYYAAKIRGAEQLHWFEKTGEKKHQQASIKHLEQAVEHWQKYAAIAGRQYRPQLLARTRAIDFNALLAAVKKDVEIARAAKPE